MHQHNINQHLHKTNTPIFGPVGIGIKQTAIEHANVTKYVMDVTLLFSSNILLNCRFGPERNMDDINDMIFPEVYKKTNGAGFPSTNLMNRRKDMNVIKYPHVKHIPNPMILCGT